MVAEKASYVFSLRVAWFWKPHDKAVARGHITRLFVSNNLQRAANPRADVTDSANMQADSAVALPETSFALLNGREPLPETREATIVLGAKNEQVRARQTVCRDVLAVRGHPEDYFFARNQP